MASDYPGLPPHHLSQPPPQSGGYVGQELGWKQQHQDSQGGQPGLSSLYPPQFHPHPHPFSSQSHDFHEAIQREIEKERIREEIIMSEIFRRRALEAEVRWELMMEREMALQRINNGFLYGSPSQMGLDMRRRLPLVEMGAEGRFSEDRSMLSLVQRSSMNNMCESDLATSLPFQSASDDVRVARNSEVHPFLEEVREKKKIMLQVPTPIKNITGAKRARDEMDASDFHSDGNLKKTEGKDAQERNLNVHLEGKEHNTQKAEWRSKKRVKFVIGLGTKKVGKPVQDSDTVDPGTGNEMKLTSESLPGSATHDLPPIHEKLASDGYMKKKVIEEWSCAICQVSPHNEKALNEHLEGKKHKRKGAALRAQKAGENCNIGQPASKKVGQPVSATPHLPPRAEKIASDNLKKEESVLPPKVHENNNSKSFWCEICQLVTRSEKVMDSHLMGKRHRRQLANVGPPSQKDGATV